MTRTGLLVLTTLVAALGVAVWPAGPASAESVAPGTYRGTYRVDRWGQRRFGFLFVSPKLHGRLKPFAGAPLAIKATRIYQPLNPSGAMVTKIGGIEKLQSPLAMSIAWQEPKAGPTEALRRVAAGGRVKLRVKATNRSGERQPLGKAEIYLVFHFHHPSGAGTADPMGYWSMHNSLWDVQEIAGGRTFSVCEETADLVPPDQALDARSLRASSPQRHSPAAPSLAPGESHAWTVTVTNLPANEFELTAVHSHYDRAAEAYVRGVSNVLRLDALAEEPLRWQGLEANLKATRASGKAPGPELEIRLTNRGERPLRFALEEAGGALDWSRALLCYDRPGTFLPVTAPKGEWGSRQVRLEPGEAFEATVDAPKGTALARLAFYHRVVIQDARPGERALGNGYVFSPHVKLTPGAGATHKKERNRR